LSQNFPNPFNPETYVNYELPIFGHVKLDVFDITGKQFQTLLDKDQLKGTYQLGFDGSKLSSGIYFYRLEVIKDKGIVFSSTKKMILIK